MIEFGDVASWLAAAVAVAFGITAGIQARKANRSAVQATDAATRSADAVERSAAAADRSAAAAERANELAEKAAERAERYVPGWRIERHQPHVFHLVNGSDETAWATTIDGGDTGLRINDGVTGQIDVAAGAAIGIVALTPWGGTRMITVTWHRREDQSDPGQTWRSPLPEAPRRPRLGG